MAGIYRCFITHCFFLSKAYLKGVTCGAVEKKSALYFVGTLTFEFFSSSEMPKKFQQNSTKIETSTKLGNVANFLHHRLKLLLDFVTLHFHFVKVAFHFF